MDSAASDATQGHQQVMTAQAETAAQVVNGVQNQPGPSNEPTTRDSAGGSGVVAGYRGELLGEVMAPGSGAAHGESIASRGALLVEPTESGELQGEQLSAPTTTGLDGWQDYGETSGRGSADYLQMGSVTPREYRNIYTGWSNVHVEVARETNECEATYTAKRLQRLNRSCLLVDHLEEIYHRDQKYLSALEDC
ncbi:unnamed protein product [Symbiodinium natans]|uniref:Uncharacterized protein n=1 Tax=Symbiodinium natans TaxID=878477 RepID=A0A812J8L9_9DINO|nr:unnamed protein product [Symbiodinium natans]